MRHRVDTIKLGRTTSHRKALLRNLATSLIVAERLETTLAKAKELRRVADRMVTLGKRGSLHARRQAAAYVRTPHAVQKLFAELAGRFADRNGGYTRIIKLGVRKGDAAPMALIEYLGAPIKPPKGAKRPPAAQQASAAETKGRKKVKAKTEKPASEQKPKKVAAKAGAEQAKTQEEKKDKAATKKKKGLGAVFGRRSKKDKKDQ